MYEVHCANCGQVGFHPSRTGAELVAETHIDETGHECRIETMTDV
jgi:hypothetical protein